MSVSLTLNPIQYILWVMIEVGADNRNNQLMTATNLVVLND